MITTTESTVYEMQIQRADHARGEWFTLLRHDRERVRASVAAYQAAGWAVRLIKTHTVTLTVVAPCELSEVA
jgi:hypothetical protein